jgi:hypothetical protein
MVPLSRTMTRGASHTPPPPASLFTLTPELGAVSMSASKAVLLVDVDLVVRVLLEELCGVS